VGTKNSKERKIVGSENSDMITNLTKGKFPDLPFASMKNSVLGAKYDLSLVFAPKNNLRALNRLYRRKDAATDILSFPLSDSAGEIFINLEEARKESKKFGRDFENFIGFLFIHGLVHLKGFIHGSRMEHEEEKIRQRFGI
jgi:probable rRNA maturation factor